LHISVPPDGEGHSLEISRAAAACVLPESRPRSAPAGDTFPDPVTGEMDWEAVADFVRGQESLRTSAMQDLLHGCSFTVPNPGRKRGQQQRGKGRGARGRADAGPRLVDKNALSARGSGPSRQSRSPSPDSPPAKRAASADSVRL